MRKGNNFAEIIRTFATHRARDGRGCSPAGDNTAGCMEQTAPAYRQAGDSQP